MVKARPQSMILADSPKSGQTYVMVPGSSVMMVPHAYPHHENDDKYLHIKSDMDVAYPL